LTQASSSSTCEYGTTVVRTLEDAAKFDGPVRVGEGLATHRIGSMSQLKVVNAILSGTHQPGTSHYDLLRAFLDETTLRSVDQELNAHGYRTHEFGDSVFRRTESRRQHPGIPVPDHLEAPPERMPVRYAKVLVAIGNNRVDRIK